MATTTAKIVVAPTRMGVDMVLGSRARYGERRNNLSRHGGCSWVVFSLAHVVGADRGARCGRTSVVVCPTRAVPWQVTRRHIEFPAPSSQQPATPAAWIHRPLATRGNVVLAFTTGMAEPRSSSVCRQCYVQPFAAMAPSTAAWHQRLFPSGVALPRRATRTPRLSPGKASQSRSDSGRCHFGIVRHCSCLRGS